MTKFSSIQSEIYEAKREPSTESLFGSQGVPTESANLSLPFSVYSCQTDSQIIDREFACTWCEDKDLSLYVVGSKILFLSL